MFYRSTDTYLAFKKDELAASQSWAKVWAISKWKHRWMVQDPLA